MAKRYQTRPKVERILVAIILKGLQKHDVHKQKSRVTTELAQDYRTVCTPKEWSSVKQKASVL